MRCQNEQTISSIQLSHATKSKACQPSMQFLQQQAKRERELREEDELFEVELSRLSWSWGAMARSGE